VRAAAGGVMKPAPDAESAEALIAAAERDGGAALAELSQAELCVLRAERASLVCERTSRWWARQGEKRREELGGQALELLTARGFLRTPPGASVVELYESVSSPASISHRSCC
jgi:hypothetical protein